MAKKSPSHQVIQILEKSPQGTRRKTQRAAAPTVALREAARGQIKRNLTTPSTEWGNTAGEMPRRWKREQATSPSRELPTPGRGRGGVGWDGVGWVG